MSCDELNLLPFLTVWGRVRADTFACIESLVSLANETTCLRAPCILESNVDIRGGSRPCDVLVWKKGFVSGASGNSIDVSSLALTPFRSVCTLASVCSTGMLSGKLSLNKCVSKGIVTEDEDAACQ